MAIVLLCEPKWPCLMACWQVYECCSCSFESLTPPPDGLYKNQYNSQFLCVLYRPNFALCSCVRPFWYFIGTIRSYSSTWRLYYVLFGAPKCPHLCLLKLPFYQACFLIAINCSWWLSWLIDKCHQLLYAVHYRFSVSAGEEVLYDL